MKIIIVRHGEAEYSDKDDDRQLTDKGKSEADSVGRYLKKLDLDPRYIIHSKKKRSYETALRISKILETSDRLKLEENAGPGGDINQIIKILKYSNGSVILVSHIPLVHNLSNYLLLDDRSNNIFRFDTGSVLLLNKNSKPDVSNIRQNWNLGVFIKPLDFGF
jgi:phosphohistidine phosphatase